MLSNPLHRFSSYHAMPSPIFSNEHPSSSPIRASGLAEFQSSNHYITQNIQEQHAIQQQQERQRQHQLRTQATLAAKHRQYPYPAPERAAIAPGSSIRRRISRACDQCNQLRTRCDGRQSCAHCIEFGLTCEYVRERKKRGKASRKDLAQQAAIQAVSSVSSIRQGSPLSGTEKSLPSDRCRSKAIPLEDHLLIASNRLRRDYHCMINAPNGHRRAHRLASQAEMISRVIDAPPFHTTYDADSLQSPTVDPVTYINNLDKCQQAMINNSSIGPVSQDPYDPQAQTVTEFTVAPYSLGSPSPVDLAVHDAAVRLTSPNLAYTMSSDTSTPSWMPVSPSPHNDPQARFDGIPTTSLQYPVLAPVTSHLNGVISLHSTCDLVEAYLAKSAAEHMSPLSP